jgi:malonyl-CoA decarboxylase
MLAGLATAIRQRVGARPAASAAIDGEPLELLCDRLLLPGSSSSKQRTALAIHARFASGADDEKRRFLGLLAHRYNADPARLNAAIARYQSAPDAESLASLHAASEPRRQQIMRQLNEVPDGTAKLLGMRSALLRMGKKGEPGFAALDADFAHLFGSWFNGGFLELRQLDWSTSGAVLTKLIRYEAVHAINSWEELRARLEPADRRCYAFFHPRMEEEPLIFVEVALTTEIPISIGNILSAERAPIDPSTANTAVFYSISNCQEGLRGIPFGGPLIKQVMDLLRRELPGLRRAVTLSPMPGFARWLEGQAKAAGADAALIAALAESGWHKRADAEALRGPLMRAAARYLTMEVGRDADPVARFHLGNGARIEQLDWLGDVSPKGLRQSHGMMVNYLYDPAHIEANYRAFAEDGTIAASSGLKRLARDEQPSRLPWRTAR